MYWSKILLLVSQDLIKTANLLFSQLDTAYVWTVCAKHFSLACSSSSPSSYTTSITPPVQGSVIYFICLFLYEFLYALYIYIFFYTGLFYTVLYLLASTVPIPIFFIRNVFLYIQYISFLCFTFCKTRLILLGFSHTSMKVHNRELSLVVCWAWTRTRLPEGCKMLLGNSCCHW